MLRRPDDTGRKFSTTSANARQRTTLRTTAAEARTHVGWRAATGLCSIELESIVLITRGGRQASSGRGCACAPARMPRLAAPDDAQRDALGRALDRGAQHEN